MKTTYLFICAALISCCINAQPAPNIDWENNLGGSDSDRGYSIRELSAGGYVVAGSTESNDGDVMGNHGGTDMWMALLDVNGNLVNQYTYGGSDNEAAYDVQQTSDGGFVLAGYTYSNDGDVGSGPNNADSDLWVVKTDAVGVIEWETSIGGTATDEVQSIQEIAGGEFVVVGSTASTDIGISNHGGFDIIFLRLNNAGNPELIKLYGGSSNDHGYKVQQTQDGGYIIGGYTASNNGDVSGNHGSNDGWALKLDANANPNIQWQTCVGAGANDRTYDIHEHSNGSYMLVGILEVSSTLKYFLVTILQSNGSISGQTTFGGTSGYGILYGLDEMPNGDYVVTGYTDFNDGDVSGNHGISDIWVAGLTSSGTLQWQKCLGGFHQQFGFAVVATSDGGAALCGTTTSSGGDVGGNNGEQDIWIVKLANPLGMEEVFKPKSLIYPNPATGHFSIDIGTLGKKNTQISIFNIFGQEIYNGNIDRPQQQISTASWAPGLYFVHLADANGTKLVEKLIVK